MENLNTMTIEDLENVIVEAKARIKELKAEAKAKAKAAAEIRGEEMRKDLEVGQEVSFLYGTKGEIITGTILRVSDKSVTIESDEINNKTGKSYVKYSRILSIIEDSLEEAV